MEKDSSYLIPKRRRSQSERFETIDLTNVNQNEATEKSKKKGSHKDSTETGGGNSFGTYPKVVFLIILTELCERFSFYGLRTVLYIFFTEFLHLSPDTGTALYHTFTMICYFSPILGAIIADGYIGLYKTILSLSIVYLIGEAIVTLTSMRPLGAPNLIGPAIGLFIIGIGTGGIKPCVSAFGGSQFNSSQTRFINTFFSVFYMSINIGSTVGTILTPILRSDVKCFGNDCYPLAFGVPAAFMFIAICSFIAGTFFYKRRGLQGNGNNVIIETVKCIFRALKNKIFLRGVKKQSWLQYADTHHSQQVISDVSAFLRVMLMFIPVPVFWALYDQQGSRWTDQAIQLDGRLGSFVVKPDQMQAVNPILIIILIPLFDFVVYPLFAKINFFKRLLQRMGVGMIFAVLSFLISALLEYKMQQALAANNPTNNIRALNLLPCNVEIFDQSGQERLIQISQAAYLNNKPVDLPKNLLSSMNNTQVQVSYSACSNGLTTPNLDSLDLAGDGPKTIVFYLENNQTKNMIVPYDNQNQKTGSSQVRFMSLNTDDFGVLTPQLSETGLTKDFQLASLSNSMSNSSYESMDYDFYEMRVKSSNSSDYLVKTKFYLASGGRYSVLIHKNEENGQLDYVLITDLYPNGVHLAWQLFQIFVMAIGEILFSISGIAFAFSQAPATMKSACQALWYIAVAIGNLIVVIVAESRFIQNQVFEYLFFAGVMAVATVVFVILALFYKYNDTQSKSDTDSNTTETEPVINKEGSGYINSALDNYYDDNVEMHF